MFLYKNSYKGNKWAARVPLSAEVPCKVRKIYGVRLGGIIWDSSTDVGRALEKQDMTNADLKTDEGVVCLKPYSLVEGRTESLDVFSNIDIKRVVCWWFDDVDKKCGGKF